MISAGWYHITFARQRVVTALTVAILSSFMPLTGYTKDALDPVQTVEWYKMHEVERKATVERCRNNAGELAATPNCVNANQAAIALTTTPTKPSSGATVPAFDPCRAEENKHLPHCQKRPQGTIGSTEKGR